MLHRHWFAVALSRDVTGDRPLARKLLGRNLVLFRDARGRASALLDHCPHRGFPLSDGRVRGGEIRCPYHGWCFDGQAACTQAPGLDRPETQLHRLGGVAFAVVERAGIVFVYGLPGLRPEGSPDLRSEGLPGPSDDDSKTAPLPLPLAEDASYVTDARDFGPMKCGAGDILENFMDSMHPPFVHGSFLNQDARRHRLELEIASVANGIEGRYLGETAPQGSLALRLFAGRHDGRIEHVERYLLPTTHQFEYRIGRTHFISTQFLSPISETETRLITIYHIRAPLPRFVTKPLLRYLFGQLIGQDYRLLERLNGHQREAPAGLPQRSTELDALGLAMRKTLRELYQPIAESGEARQSSELKSFRVPMWL